MRDIVAMVLAGGRVEELSVLTQQRPKAAVPFGGQYRIIDFALSSVMHADVDHVGVVSLYRPSSLIEHLGIGEPWDLVGRGRGVRVLPPYTAETHSQWYRGTADAIYQNLGFIEARAPRDVLILSGDHIHGMELGPFIDQHRETDADLSIVVKAMPPGAGQGRFGYAEIDADNRVIGYEEKPEHPRTDLASLTIYLFKAEVLAERLEANQRTGRAHQLYSEILPDMVARDRVHAFHYDGYWNYARSLDDFHQAHMDMLGERPALQIESWSIRSRRLLRGLGDLPPARLEKGCACRDSLIAPGVRIAGSVSRCVVSPGVVVEAGAEVTESVLMRGATIRTGARVDRALLDKSAVVGAEARVGDGETGTPNKEYPLSVTRGVTAVGKRATIPARARTGRNCLIYPDVRDQDWPKTGLEHGASLRSTSGGRP